MYEWDEAKSAATFKDRGFGFEIMEGFLWDFTICVEVQHHDGEEREKWIGPIDDQLFTVVLIQDEGTIRVITMWRAARTEIILWRKEFEG